MITLNPEIESYLQKQLQELVSKAQDAQSRISVMMQEHTQLCEEIDALRKILGIRVDENDSEHEDVKLTFNRLRAQQRRLQFSVNPPKVIVSENGNRSPIIGFGLRDSIRYVLEHSKKSLRPIEVTAKLKEFSFAHDGKVELSTRVGNEMWRMARQGHLKKRKARYSINAG